MDYLFSTWIGVALAIFLFLIAVLWFLLPFAVFGIKDRLTELIKETKIANAARAALLDAIKGIKQ